MILYLKRIKYYLKNNKLFGHLFLIIKLFLNGKMIKNFFSFSKFPNIGNFKTKINIFNFEEIKILDKNYYDHPNLQSFRSLKLNKTNIFIYSDNILLNKFFSKTLNIKVLDLLNLKKKNKEKHKRNYENVLITDEISSLRNKNKIALEKMDFIFTKKNTNYLKEKYFKYNYIQGRIFPDSHKYPSYYKLLSKKKINIKKNSGNKISGFSTIKSLDIYPFDLAYESVLPYVDEFILGIDSSSYSTKYEKLLNNYLKKSKYKNKIKCIFFDFNSETTLDIKVRGRWITDANNKIINECSEKYCLYVQADEVFPKMQNSFFKNIYKAQFDEVYFNFLHYVYNLETIIDPKKSSYTEAIRIFNKDLYAASHDGFSFHNLSEFRPLRCTANYTINHISYVFNFKNKIKEHFEKKDGLHINQLSKKKFINNYIVPKKVRNIKNDLIHLKYLNSYKFLN